MRISRHTLKGIRDIYGANTNVRVYAYVDSTQDFQFLALPLSKQAPQQHTRNPSYRLAGVLDLQTGDIGPQPVTPGVTRERAFDWALLGRLLLAALRVWIWLCWTALMVLMFVAAVIGRGGHGIGVGHKRRRR